MLESCPENLSERKNRRRKHEILDSFGKPALASFCLGEGPRPDCRRVRDNLDENGEVEKDVKNPDKSKRDTPCDQIVLIEKMTYNEKKDSWGDTKIYDPTRGIKANVTCSFESVSKLRVRGSVLGIGETVYWDKIE